VIYIVIPCYQGAAAVGEVVKRARAHGHPVVVIDDGSTDGSGAVASAAGADHVLRHAVNRGKGAALQTGFAFARTAGAEAVLTLDADGQHDTADIPRLVAAHAEDPRAIVIGVRSLDRGSMPRRSRIGNQFSTWWICRFAGRAHTDSQSGFRVYPRELFARARLRTRRFETETELLLLAAKLRLPLKEVPVRTIYPAGQGTNFHAFFDSMRVLKLIVSSPFWPAPRAAQDEDA
jgi:glycosyltransferase involved in cell wall biosynthesis